MDFRVGQQGSPSTVDWMKKIETGNKKREDAFPAIF
jgi:hypothetical protein